MKVLLINKFLHPNGGSETYIFKLGRCLELQGHEVQYFGMDHDNRCVGNYVGAYTSNMDFHNTSIKDKLSYPIRTIYSVEARRKIRMVLENFQPNVVHLNNFNYQLTPSVILEVVKWRKETEKSCKIIFTAHDYQLICPNHMLCNPNTKTICERCLGGKYANCMFGKCIHGSLAKSVIGMAEAYFWKSNKVYKYIDKIICCSDFMKAKLDTNPLFVKKTITIHNFVDKIEWKDIKKKDYILYFGRYSEEKGIRTLIEVCKELPEINFVFAGSGPLEEKINRIQNIKNVGFQSDDSLRMLIREARFSVCPSEWYEAFGLTIAESICLGTPVIAANIGGIPEVIENEKTGELFNSGDADELKKRILALWSDEATLEKYYNNCRNANLNSVEKYVNEIMEIYSAE